MTNAAVMPKMFLAVLDIFWRRRNGVGSIFSADGDFVFHVLGHFAFHRSGFADAAAGQNESAADNNHDPGGLHEADFISFMNFSQSKSRSDRSIQIVLLPAAGSSAPACWLDVINAPSLPTPYHGWCDPGRIRGFG